MLAAIAAAHYHPSRSGANTRKLPPMQLAGGQLWHATSCGSGLNLQERVRAEQQQRPAAEPRSSRRPSRRQPRRPGSGSGSSEERWTELQGRWRQAARWPDEGGANTPACLPTPPERSAAGHRRMLRRAVRRAAPIVSLAVQRQSLTPETAPEPADAQAWGVEYIVHGETVQQELEQISAGSDSDGTCAAEDQKCDEQPQQAAHQAAEPEHPEPDTPQPAEPESEPDSEASSAAARLASITAKRAATSARLKRLEKTVAALGAPAFAPARPAQSHQLIMSVMRRIRGGLCGVTTRCK